MLCPSSASNFPLNYRYTHSLFSSIPYISLFPLKVVLPFKVQVPAMDMQILEIRAISIRTYSFNQW